MSNGNSILGELTKNVFLSTLETDVFEGRSPAEVADRIRTKLNSPDGMTWMEATEGELRGSIPLPIESDEMFWATMRFLFAANGFVSSDAETGRKKNREKSRFRRRSD